MVESCSNSTSGSIHVVAGSDDRHAGKHVVFVHARA
jgi:hypothetical protein